MNGKSSNDKQLHAIDHPPGPIRLFCCYCEFFGGMQNREQKKRKSSRREREQRTKHQIIFKEKKIENKPSYI